MAVADHPADPVEVLADVEDADLPEHIEQVYSRWAAAGVRHGEGSPEERRAGRELSVALARRSIAALTAAGVPPTPVGQVLDKEQTANALRQVLAFARVDASPGEVAEFTTNVLGLRLTLRPVGPTTAEEER